MRHGIKYRYIAVNHASSCIGTSAHRFRSCFRYSFMRASNAGDRVKFKCLAKTGHRTVSQNCCRHNPRSALHDNHTTQSPVDSPHHSAWISNEIGKSALEHAVCENSDLQRALDMRALRVKVRTHQRGCAAAELSART